VLFVQRTKNYVFSFEHVLSFKGNSAVFLMYAIARLSVRIEDAGLLPAPTFEARVFTSVLSLLRVYGVKWLSNLACLVKQPGSKSSVPSSRSPALL
jgi:hypothetical protein